ncbi:MAG: erythromycin esterase family protein [Opitutus sp.]
MRFSFFAVALSFFLAASSVQAADAAAGPPARVVEWIKSTALPLSTTEAGNGFDDLAPLAAKLAGAEVVALGEDTHGTHEVFQTKHRLIEYFVSELGFSVFAIEANMPEARRLNDYVMGGEGDVAALIRGMYFWTWTTTEMRDLVEWMRKFNTDPAHRAAGRQVQFTGFDMQTPDVASRIATDFLHKYDQPEFLPKVEAAQKAVTSTLGGRDFGVATGRFPVELARGKKVVFSGWIKTEDLQGYAGLWWRADTPAQTAAAFDNMQSRGPRGTTDWQRYEVTLPVPADTKNINFGMLMPGEGTAWFDDLAITIDGVPYDPAGAFGFDFEGDALTGFPVTSRAGYEVSIQPGGHGGKQALRMKSIAVETLPPEQVLALWTDVEARIASISVDAGGTMTAAERTWARQNARLVIQQLGMTAKTSSRDHFMADNVMWLREQNPGAKIVLWAHNGHVAKREDVMGGELMKRLGKRFVVFGFASGTGQYRANSRDVPAVVELPLTAPLPDSVEEACAATALARFILDLRPSRDAASPAWFFNLPRRHRMIGSMELVGRAQFQSRTVGAEYDFLIWLSEVRGTEALN